MRRVHPTGWRGDGLAPVKTLRALIFVISGHGSRPSGGLQERSNWKDIDSAGKLSIDYGRDHYIHRSEGRGDDAS